MIAVLMLAAAQAALTLPAAATSPAERRYDDCVALTRSNPGAAVKNAEEWRVGGGGLSARQCLGLAFAALERWLPAEAAFEQAATEAETDHDGRAATFWVQAGNAALAGSDPAKARQAFDRALALPVMADPLRGETLIDRARADVAANDLPAARTDLDAGIKLMPADPLAWLLSATLARRQHDPHRAAKDLAEAERLAPGNDDIAAERAHIAAVSAPAAAPVAGR